METKYVYIVIDKNMHSYEAVLGIFDMIPMFSTEVEKSLFTDMIRDFQSNTDLEGWYGDN